MFVDSRRECGSPSVRRAMFVAPALVRTALRQEGHVCSTGVSADRPPSGGPCL